MSIQIYLDNYQNVCYPGQTISGRVECDFNKDKNLRAVRIKFKGLAETQWTESESYYDHSSKKHKTRSVRYYGEEVYMDSEYSLVQGGDNFQLSAGRHIYPFSYILPQQLPGSFEGTYGGVRYYLKATIDRPWKFDYEAKVVINVLSPLDLNFMPALKSPAAVSDEKTTCSCWCNDSGAITFNVTLPVTGYVPGQEVNVGAYVQNMTNVSAESVKFKITANYEFISHSPSTHHRYDSVRIVDCVEGGIGAHGEKSWTSILKIPTELIYPNLIPCSILNVSYTLVGKAVLPFPHTNLELEIPLTIGSVPLAGVSTSLPGPPPTNISIDFPPEGGDYPEKYPGGPPPAGIVPYPPPGGASAPYPGGSSATYPDGTGNAPYPNGPAAPYPNGPAAPYSNGPAVPYPGGAAASYPGGAAPYPGGAAASYPGGAAAPFPGGSTALYPGGSTAPYPGGAAAPYPGGFTAPYPPGSSTGAPYPPGPSVGAPYASAPTPEKSPLYTAWSMPGDASASAPPPPSYEDSQKLPEKEKL